jgi:hypothetical protein
MKRREEVRKHSRKKTGRTQERGKSNRIRKIKKKGKTDEQ